MPFLVDRERHRSGSAHGLSSPSCQVVLLAGGAALVAQNLTTRPTQDLDFFTSLAGGSVLAARGAFEAAAGERNWRVERIQTKKHLSVADSR